MFSSKFSRQPFSRSFGIEIFSLGTFKLGFYLYDSHISTPYVVNIETEEDFKVNFVLYDSKIITIVLPVQLDLSIVEFPWVMEIKKNFVNPIKFIRSVNLRHELRGISFDDYLRNMSFEILNRELIPDFEIRPIDLDQYELIISPELEKNKIEIDKDIKTEEEGTMEPGLWIRDVFIEIRTAYQKE